MLRAFVLLTLVPSCDPGDCGHIYIKGVAPNAAIEKYREPDGRLAFSERCTDDWGALAEERVDLGLTVLTFDANAPDGGDGYEISRVVLPAASVVFWDAHLVKGNTITIKQLAGSGLHK